MSSHLHRHIWLLVFPILLLEMQLPLAATPREVPCRRGQPITHGRIQCDEGAETCQLQCDYGFTPTRSQWTCKNDEVIQEYGQCVPTMVFIVGGMSVGGEYTNSVEIFAPSDRQLSERIVADFPYPVRSPSAIWVQDHVLVCGGFNIAQDSYESRCWFYDACSNSWAHSTSMTESRSDAAGVAIRSSEPWILGGKNESPIDSSEIWKVSEGMWTSGPSLDSEKYGHCGAVTRDDQWLVITGGENSYKTVEIFHLDNFETHFVEVKLNHQRSQHSCLTYSDEGSQGFIVAGGLNAQSMPVDTVEIWNPNTNMWREGPRLYSAIYGSGMAVVDGKPSIFGGKSLLGSPTDRAFALYKNDKREGIDDDDVKNGLQSETFEWREMEVGLTSPRALAGTAEVPVTMFDRCN